MILAFRVTYSKYCNQKLWKERKSGDRYDERIKSKDIREKCDIKTKFYKISQMTKSI